MTTIKAQAIIPPELAGLRLDQALAKLFPDYSRSRLQSWITSGAITVDGKVLRPKDKVTLNQQIIINAELPSQDKWQPQAMELDIIYEDDDLLVINKPAGVVVHPGAGNPDKTLLNALLHHVPSLSELPRAGIVHRLDKDTSGLLVIAKTLPTHTKLIAQMQSRKVKREYQAIVQGVLVAGGMVDAPIGRHPSMRTRMAIVASGKPAISHYRVIERFANHTHLQINLETGRTHQIRVHMASIHHPVLGDPVYGGRLKLPQQASEELKVTLVNFKRQALHAYRLGLAHPITHEYIEWQAALPEDMQNLLTLLRTHKLNPSY